MIPYVRDFDFEYGRPDQVSPLIRRVIARNPGPFTFTGTGTYIVGHGEVAVIDPGPLDEVHLDALLAALDGETVTHILVTHTHMDHSPLAPPLSIATDAPVRLGSLMQAEILFDTPESGRNDRVPFGPSEEAVVKTALHDLTGYPAGNSTLHETTIPRLWHHLNEPTDALIEQCRYASRQHFFDETRLLRMWPVASARTSASHRPPGLWRNAW